ncbi:MarR family winged helix-turn-helix transcriptional regulator [Streptomyces sp. HUCO-GS316]|uniref:MarR family winged helix-turn-helix transcriptional regulator n=1 Tax=Streptomyces sp. HUCO-GS316 TaxID=2692198 RepID=UPI001F4685C3|nr:MarR family transcriptional regulator [Streptomyces sp. HUCO-GS316]
MQWNFSCVGRFSFAVCPHSGNPPPSGIVDRPVEPGLGLGEGEFDVLCALRRAGEPYERAPGELAAHTMVTTGRMTKRIDRLERAGLVTRRRSDDAQRGRIVALTRPGRELIDQAFTDHMRNERHLLDLLTPDEAESLETLLSSWLSRMEHAQAPGGE